MEGTIPYYYRVFNRHLLNLLPSGMTRVLEFGCAGGMLGKAYKEANPNAVWHGIEIEDEPADYARQHLDDVWVLDANNFLPEAAMLEAPYDAIVYGDVIEHFIDPMESLPTHLSLLKPGGELCACIPNVQHWSLIKELLKGNWTYRDSGLLDNTHLRFFTRKSILSMVKSLNLELVALKGLSHESNPSFKKTAAQRTEFLELVKLLCDSYGIEFSETDFRTFQFLLRAKTKG